MKRLIRNLLSKNIFIDFKSFKIDEFENWRVQ